MLSVKASKNMSAQSSTMLQNGHSNGETRVESESDNLEIKEASSLKINGLSNSKLELTGVKSKIHQCPNSDSSSQIPAKSTSERHRNEPPQKEEADESELSQQLQERLNLSQDVSQLQTSHQVEYAVYQNELQMPDIMKLIQKDLSEPYSIYTYRYFIHNWPHLCFMVRHWHSPFSISTLTIS